MINKRPTRDEDEESERKDTSLKALTAFQFVLVAAVRSFPTLIRPDFRSRISQSIHSPLRYNPWDISIFAEPCNR